MAIIKNFHSQNFKEFKYISNFSGYDNNTIKTYIQKELLNKEYYENKSNSYYQVKNEVDLIYLKVITIWPVFQIDNITKNYENNISAGLIRFITPYMKIIKSGSSDCQSYNEYKLINYTQTYFAQINNKIYSNNFDGNYVTFEVNLTNKTNSCLFVAHINAFYEKKEVISYSRCINNVCSCFEYSKKSIIKIEKTSEIYKVINTTLDSYSVFSLIPPDNLFLKNFEPTKILVINSIPLVKLHNLSAKLNVVLDDNNEHYIVRYEKLNKSVYKQLNLSKLFNNSEEINFVHLLELTFPVNNYSEIETVDAFGRIYVHNIHYNLHNYIQKNKNVIRMLKQNLT
ncbi:MAG: hypothetical protein QXJ06_00785 [Candidatus Aenigmatarchaeota archaeon]